MSGFDFCSVYSCLSRRRPSRQRRERKKTNTNPNSNTRSRRNPSPNREDNVLLLSREVANELHRFTGHRDRVIAVAFSTDGTQILTAGRNDRTVKLWNTATGELIRDFPRQKQNIVSAALSPDGTQILTGGSAGDSPGEVMLRDAATG